MEQHFMAAILAVGIAAGWAVAQQESAERHVPEITAERKAKYPQGVADSVLCQRAREQHPPYSRFRWHEPDLAKMEKDLEALMRESDEVVMVGTPQRWVTALSPSGEDAISYADVRVLYSWKGSHKVGDVITFGSPAVSAGKEPIFANGVDQDPLREKYHDKPIGNFLRAVHAAADEQAHRDAAQKTNP